MEYSECPNCKSAIKDGIFNENKIIEQQKTNALNRFLNQSSIAYCDKCFGKQLDDAKAAYYSQLNEKDGIVNNLLANIPIILAGGLKIIYDLLLFRNFRKIKLLRGP